MPSNQGCSATFEWHPRAPSYHWRRRGVCCDRSEWSDRTRPAGDDDVVLWTTTLFGLGRKFIIDAVSSYSHRHLYCIAYYCHHTVTPYCLLPASSISLCCDVAKLAENKIEVRHGHSIYDPSTAKPVSISKPVETVLLCPVCNDGGWTYALPALDDGFRGVRPLMPLTCWTWVSAAMLVSTYSSWAGGAMQPTRHQGFASGHSKANVYGGMERYARPDSWLGFHMDGITVDALQVIMTHWVHQQLRQQAQRTRMRDQCEIESDDEGGRRLVS